MNLYTLSKSQMSLDSLPSVQEQNIQYKPVLSDH